MMMIQNRSLIPPIQIMNMPEKQMTMMITMKTMIMLKMKTATVFHLIPLHHLHLQHLHSVTYWIWKIFHDDEMSFVLFHSAFSLQQTIRFEQQCDPSTSFCENAFPPALHQPNPERVEDCHTFAVGFQCNRPDDFKHRIHIGAIHDIPICAHIPRIFADRVRIRCNEFSAAVVI